MPTNTDLTGTDLARLIEALGGAIRNLSVRTGPNEYAMPLNRGVDLAAALLPEIEEMVREQMAAAWDAGATKASPHGGGYLRSLLIENPYRPLPS